MRNSFDLPWDVDSKRFEVSVIVPTFNRAYYIDQCLDSLLKQSVPAAEIIVIDDGSEDDTENVIAKYDDRIIYIYKENSGKPDSVNLALEKAKGNLVWIFDDDDVAFPEAIETRVEKLRQNPWAGFVYSSHFRGTNGADGTIVKSDLYQPPVFDESRFFYELLKGCFFHLGSALVRIEAYLKVGAFDSNLMSSEDYDIQIRLARMYKGVYSSSPSFIFRQHEDLRGAKKVRYSASKRSQVFKHYDKIIGQKILREVKLGEYLCPPKYRSDLSQKDRIDALLNRMVVMGSKGCIQEMFDDLVSILKVSTTDEYGKIEHKISSAVIKGYAYMAVQNDVIKLSERIKVLKRYPGGAHAISGFSKGLFRLAKSYPGSIAERLTRLYYCIAVRVY